MRKPTTCYRMDDPVRPYRKDDLTCVMYHGCGILCPPHPANDPVWVKEMEDRGSVLTELVECIRRI